MRRARRDASSRVPAREIAIVSLLVAALLGLAGTLEGNSLAIGSAVLALARPQPGEPGSRSSSTR